MHFGANIGGIGTPIGTPPNSIAIGILEDYGISIDFIGWMVMAVPLVIILLDLTTLILFLFFPIKTKTISFQFSKKPVLSSKGIGVLFLACLIIFLWLTTP